MPPLYKELEILVAKIQVQLAPDAEVLHDVRVDGHLSGTKRQIDVLVKQRVGQFEMRIAIECKDYARPVDVKAIEEFRGLLEDVSAHKGAIVCPKGFTASAKKRAAKLNISLYSPVDTAPHKWQVRVTMPTIVDFRGAAISFGVSCNAPMPFLMPRDYFSSVIAYDQNGAELGVPCLSAYKKWNSGKLPSEVGIHDDLPIFETKTVFTDNGYGRRIPVDLTFSILVEATLFFGELPVPRITGFKDELSSGVITNAFEVGIVSPDEIFDSWQRITSFDDAPKEPALVLTGRLCWPAEPSQSENNQKS